MRETHILQEQEYIIGHGVSAIPDEVHGKTRRQPGLHQVSTEQVGAIPNGG